jgi:hypothetical protein
VGIPISLLSVNIILVWPPQKNEKGFEERTVSGKPSFSRVQKEEDAIIIATSVPWRVLDAL